MSLQYNVAQMLKSEVGSTRSYHFATDEPFDLDEGVADRLSGQVKFTLTNFGVLAQVEADAVLHLACARCLETFETPTHVAFNEEYQPLIDISTGLPAAIPPSDTAFQISQSHTIDLREAIRQNLVLAVDIIPVCRDDCRGLCPTCGVNRNTEICHCPPAEAASPFAVLQGLLVKSDEK
jgi:uncharacterized protein